jgi:hypothetical protein
MLDTLLSIPNPETLEHIMLCVEFRITNDSTVDWKLLEKQFFSKVMLSERCCVHVDMWADEIHGSEEDLRNGLASVDLRGALKLNEEPCMAPESSPVTWKNGLYRLEKHSSR